MNIVTFDVFERSIGAGAGWFILALRKIKEFNKLDKRVITDIYIREGEDIFFGVLKTMFSEQLSALNPQIKSIDSKDMMDLLEKLLYIRASQLNIRVDIDSYIHNLLQNKNVISFSLSVEGLGVMRITYSKSANGNVLAIRLLDFVVPKIEEVRLSADYMQFLLSLLRHVNIRVPFKNETVSTKTVARGGLIIHCGVTGSGKTTTMASQLDFLSRNIGGMIITYEDPIEYMFTGYKNVLQYELHDHLTEDEIYDHFLRATAQVGLVGEVRKIENISRIVDLASRGHLMFTTLHASGVVEALYILKEAMKDNLPLLASSLVAITHQRLELKNGKIEPVYTHLLFKEVEQTSQIRKMIEDNKGYQDLVNFFKNNENLLKAQKVLLKNE